MDFINKLFQNIGYFIPIVFSLISIVVAAWLGFGFERIKERMRYKAS